MSNIIFLPSESENELHPNFKKQLEECYEKLPAKIADSVYLYVVENHLSYFPNATKKKPHFQYCEERRYPAGEQEQVNNFVRAVQNFSGIWTINGVLPKKDSRIYVFLNFKDKNQIEKQYFSIGGSKTNSGNQEDTPPLNVVPVEPKYRFANMVLNQEVKDQLDSCVTMIRNLDKIYDEWGFSEVDPVKKSVLNFYGPPGTGKTMAAHALSAELGKMILAINYSDVESKFVGDAPKNLVSVFKIAEERNCVLFFDEADSFLGKRVTNVSSSSDQAVNSLRSQMLILLESFPGTVIFATNLNENYDQAFVSRIISSIQFRLPDTALRKDAITRMIPTRAPIDRSILTDELLDDLAELCDGFSHREIKNVALSVLTECCKNDSPITEQLLRDVFKTKKASFEIERKKSKNGESLGKEIKKKLESGNYKVLGQKEELKEPRTSIGYDHLSADFLNMTTEKGETT